MTATSITTSPWGRPIDVVEIAPGISYVHTLDHGGFHLSEQCLAEVPADWRRARWGSAGSEAYPWFEEDADAALVVLAFPAEFNLENLNYARRAFDATFAAGTTTPRAEG